MIDDIKNKENFKLMEISKFLNNEIKNFNKTPHLDYGEKMALQEAMRIEKIVHEIINEGE